MLLQEKNGNVIPYNLVYNINEHDTRMTCYRWYDKSGSESNMKIDRLIGILSVLLQEEKVTAPELAKTFEPSMKWHLIEEHGAESFTELSDGKLLFEHTYADDEGLLSWLLSLRDKVTVIEPESIRKQLLRIATELTEKYKEA